jgi:hypothetical protein
MQEKEMSRFKWALEEVTDEYYDLSGQVSRGEFNDVQRVVNLILKALAFPTGAEMAFIKSFMDNRIGVDMGSHKGDKTVYIVTYTERSDGSTFGYPLLMTSILEVFSTPEQAWGFVNKNKNRPGNLCIVGRDVDKPPEQEDDPVV